VDLNGDGRLDVLTSNRDSNDVSVLLGDGAGGFLPQTSYAVGTTPMGLAAADFNGDGIPDVAVANSGSTFVSILLGDGSGGLVPHGQVSDVGPFVEMIAAADFDGDGAVDLAVGDRLTLTLLHGDGTGGFTIAVRYRFAFNDLEVADFNGDSRPDLLLNDEGGSVTVVLNVTPGGPRVSVEGAVAHEGEVGVTNLVFTVRRFGADGTTATVNYSTSPGTATAGVDYVPVSGVLTFPPGVSTRTIAVPVRGDRVAESDETFFVNLSAPTNASIGDGQALGTIIDDDPAGLSIDDVRRVEGGTALFTVTLSPPNMAATVTVDYATADGTAMAGSDYTATAGTLTFPPGTTTQTVSVSVLGDTLVEGAETFFVDLSLPSNATIAYARGTGTILDSDGAGDFDRDGQTDILWRHRTAGWNIAWLMAGNTFHGGAVLQQVTDMNWQIRGTADFDNDGQTDILWRNRATGDDLVWLMTGTSI
jgi:hypothetical protein